MENINQQAGNIHSDFGLVEFLDEANFDQFIEFIKGEHTDDSIANLCPRIDCANIPSCFDASHFVLPTQENNATSIYGNQNYGASLVSVETMRVLGEDEYAGEASSATTTTTTTMPKMSSQTKKSANKADRSRTLISERRRRFRMKEKLYALRALVPNITKMDKASIIGDAVAYVEDLQMQARKLKAEISELESSLTQTDKYNGTDYFHNMDNLNSVYTYPLIKTITQLEVFQVEERGFYTRVGCQKGKGVAVLLYKVLESFVNANVTNSNLITAAEVYILTFTLTIKKECKVDMNVNNLKLWIATAFLNHGFDFETTVLLA
ncbi:hypothetical protein Leryth_013880 [Lithospermum erythrorhizon]|nr:hypothetical protein Leryth_013880 [Lithospermum erythrorhizon]